MLGVRGEARGEKRDEEYREVSQGEGWNRSCRGGQGREVEVCLVGCNITNILVLELRPFVRAT